MKNTNVDIRIREEWFPNHTATYTEHNGIKVLMWKKNGTSNYHIRYVFDQNKMYVSGDLGEAIFWFTEVADLDNISQYDLYYFDSKLTAFSDDRKSFNSDLAVSNLSDWRRGLRECDKKYDHEEMQELFASARNCTSTREWEYIVNNKSDFIGDLDNDYWEWMYNIGDEIPMRIRSYLIGLQMASEQLKAKENIE